MAESSRAPGAGTGPLSPATRERRASWNTRTIPACLLAVVLAVVLVGACSAGTDGRGRASTEALVDAYLVALQAGDSEAMLSLTSPSVDARAEVDTVIRKNGGHQLTDVTVGPVVDDFGGAYVVATVSGTNASDGARIELTIPMGRDGGQYYLALGQAAPSGNEANPASPTAAAS